MTINKNTRIVSDKLIKRIINKRVTLKSVKDTKDLIRILNSHNLFPSDNSYAEGIIKNKGYYFITGY